MTEPPYDAVLLLSFGGPEGMDEVLPFLENVLRGRNVPRERLLEVAEHYYEFGGVSPINEQNKALIRALVAELNEHGPPLSVYWGNRNWHPLLPETLALMAEDGVRRALAFVTSAWGSYSGCRQYLENIAAARAEVGPEAPQVDKLRAFFNHPGFIEPMIERTRAALQKLPPERRDKAALLFAAHSIPLSMAATSRYEEQLREASRLIAEGVGRVARPRLRGRGETASDGHAHEDVGVAPTWRLVYQSRSGPPSQPWLEPDVCNALREVRAAGATDAVVVPVGFISDHMEVVYDLDTEAASVAEEIGLNLVRAGTVGTHPRFVRMIRELIEERTSAAPKLALGALGPAQDVCPEGCCALANRT